MESLMQVMAAKKRELSVIQKERMAKKEKYMRRGDVEELLYAQEQKELEMQKQKQKKNQLQQTQEQEDKQQQQRHANDCDDSATTATGATSKKRKLAEAATAGTTHKRKVAVRAMAPDDDMTVTLSWADMKRRLRDLGEPVTLFGESKRARMERLRQAEGDAASRREDAVGGGHGIRNQFVGHARSHEDTAQDRADDLDGEDDDDDDDQTRSDDEDGDDKARADTRIVYRFFKGMLTKWETELGERPDHIKRTAQGKIATKTMKQCKDYIRPLFRLAKRRCIPSDVLPSLVEIVRCCEMGEFVLANDAYIKLAIGNAAWPIGVTMVGIHERTGREKINANKQAHVMNNEAQRKYITSVKRLISYAQSIASVLPSKKVG